MTGAAGATQGRTSRAKRWVAVLAAVTLLGVTGCSSATDGAQSSASTSSKDRASATSASSRHGERTADVTAEDGGTVRLPGGASITAAPGSLAGDGTLTGRAVAEPPPAPNGLVAGGAWDFTLSGTTIADTLAVRLPVRAKQAPRASVLAYWDPAARSWTPMGADYDASTHTMTAQTPHLTLFALFHLDVDAVNKGATSLLKGFFGVADTGTPRCPHAKALADLGITVTSDKGDLVKWCAGATNGNPQVRVTNHRSYSIEISYPAAWTATRLGNSDAVTDRVVRSVTHTLSPTAAGRRSLIVPGGRTVAVHTDGRGGFIRATPSSQAFLVDAFLYAAQTLAMTFEPLPWWHVQPTRTAKAVANAFDSLECVRNLKDLLDNEVTNAHQAGELFRTATGIATSCLADQWRVAYGMAGAVGEWAVNALLWLVDGIKLVVRGTRVAIESAIYWRDYRIAVPGVCPADDPVRGALCTFLTAVDTGNTGGLTAQERDLVAGASPLPAHSWSSGDCALEGDITVKCTVTFPAGSPTTSVDFWVQPTNGVYNDGALTFPDGEEPAYAVVDVGTPQPL